MNAMTKYMEDITGNQRNLCVQVTTVKSSIFVLSLVFLSCMILRASSLVTTLPSLVISVFLARGFSRCLCSSSASIYPMMKDFVSMINSIIAQNGERING